MPIAPSYRRTAAGIPLFAARRRIVAAPAPTAARPLWPPYTPSAQAAAYLIALILGVRLIAAFVAALAALLRALLRPAAVRAVVEPWPLPAVPPQPQGGSLRRRTMAPSALGPCAVCNKRSTTR